MPRAARVLIVIALVIALVVAIMAGLHAWRTRSRGNPQAVEFDTVTISPALADKQILAFGEATHGNHEFQRVRTILTRLLVDRGFTTIALEADYGSVWLANRWINGLPGPVTDAEEAAAALGFALYRTRETAEWLAWLQAENLSRAPGERIQLVGIDFQLIDGTRQLLEIALRPVDPQLADAVASALAPYSTDWQYEADRAGLEGCRATAQMLLEQVRAAGLADPAPAQALTALLQNCQTRMDEQAYLRLRDGFMFTNLEWLVNTSGAAHLLLFAHSGHVEKTGSGFGFDPRMVSLGRAAAERWGDRYGVIGSDFHHTTVLASDGDGERKEFSVTNRTPLRGIFAVTGIGYLDFAEADQTNRALLEVAQPAGSLGDRIVWPAVWVPQLHSVSLVPAAAYDALVFVERATPVTPL